MKAVGSLATLDDSTQDAFFSIPAYWLNLGSEGLLKRETGAEEDQNWIWLRQHYADLITTTSAEPWCPLSVTELIHYVEKEASLPFAKRLADRLRFLIEASEEEYPNQAPISPESLIDFVKFLKHFSKILYPEVVLAYSGNLRTEWRNTEKGIFVGLEFLGKDDVKCVLFLPNRKQPNKRESYGVTTTIDLLSERLDQVGAYSWLISVEESAK